MTVGLAVAVRNARNDAITTFAAGSALLRIYSGTRPATADTALSGNTLLAQLTCNATFAPASSAGVLTLNAITQDASADATGTATFARLVKSDGTTVVLDCSVGTSGADINLNTTSIVAAGPVSVTSLVYTDGNP